MELECKLRIDIVNGPTSKRPSEAIIKLGKEKGEIYLQCHTKQNKTGNRYKVNTFYLYHN